MMKQDRCGRASAALPWLASVLQTLAQPRTSRKRTFTENHEKYSKHKKEPCVMVVSSAPLNASRPRRQAPRHAQRPPEQHGERHDRHAPGRRGTARRQRGRVCTERAPRPRVARTRGRPPSERKIIQSHAAPAAEGERGARASAPAHG